MPSFTVAQTSHGISLVRGDMLIEKFTGEWGQKSWAITQALNGVAGVAMITMMALKVGGVADTGVATFVCIFLMQVLVVMRYSIDWMRVLLVPSFLIDVAITVPSIFSLFWMFRVDDAFAWASVFYMGLLTSSIDPALVAVKRFKDAFGNKAIMSGVVVFMIAARVLWELRWFQVENFRSAFEVRGTSFTLFGLIGILMDVLVFRSIQGMQHAIKIDYALIHGGSTLYFK